MRRNVRIVRARGWAWDRISDIFCNILRSGFITYTEQVCQRHAVTKCVPFSSSTGPSLPLTRMACVGGGACVDPFGQAFLHLDRVLAGALPLFLAPHLALAVVAL